MVNLGPLVRVRVVEIEREHLRPGIGVGRGFLDVLDFPILARASSFLGEDGGVDEGGVVEHLDVEESHSSLS